MILGALTMRLSRQRGPIHRCRGRGASIFAKTDHLSRRNREGAWRLDSPAAKVGAESPIHVFGGLNTLLTPYISLPAPNSSTGLHGFDTPFWMGISTSRDTMPIFQRNFDFGLASAQQVPALRSRRGGGSMRAEQ